MIDIDEQLAREERRYYKLLDEYEENRDDGV